MAGRPPTYANDDARPVSVSLRVPRTLYAQVQERVRQRRMTLSEALLEGLQLWLDTPTDPREVLLSDECNTVMQQLRDELKGALLDELRHEVAELLASAAGDGLGTERAGLSPAPREILYDNNITVLQKERTKQCRYGHAPYPSTREECPTCVKQRQARRRAKKKTQREAQETVHEEALQPRMPRRHA
jgi:hypothetical protein